MGMGHLFMHVLLHQRHPPLHLPLLLLLLLHSSSPSPPLHSHPPTTEGAADIVAALNFLLSKLVYEPGGHRWLLPPGFCTCRIE